VVLLVIAYVGLVLDRGFVVKIECFLVVHRDIVAGLDHHHRRLGKGGWGWERGLIVVIHLNSHLSTKDKVSFRVFDPVAPVVPDGIFFNSRHDLSRSHLGD
jgi:hypothetical protein